MKIQMDYKGLKIVLSNFFFYRSVFHQYYHKNVFDFKIGSFESVHLLKNKIMPKSSIDYKIWKESFAFLIFNYAQDFSPTKLFEPHISL